MPTGYEVDFYNDVKAIRRTLDRIADSLEKTKGDQYEMLKGFDQKVILDYVWENHYDWCVNNAKDDSIPMISDPNDLD
jgi:hypothetical protein